MAKLIMIAVLLAVHAILVAADECKCTDEIPKEELEELWKFLSENNSEEFTLPGELTELVPCRNCIEQNRRKRKIQEEVVGQLKKESRRSLTMPKMWSHENKRNKCPIGYRRFFWRCVPFKY